MFVLIQVNCSCSYYMWKNGRTTQGAAIKMCVIVLPVIILHKERSIAVALLCRFANPELSLLHILRYT